jgi:PIN domain nuclease of toxin-antitoxin system
VILLLDAHAFLWFVWDDRNLSSSAKACIEDPANRKLVSLASCWEILHATFAVTCNLRARRRSIAPIRCDRDYWQARISPVNGPSARFF